MARLISLLLACVTTTNATSSLTVAKVDADVRVPNVSFAEKVNTAVLQVHTAGPSFLLFGFPKCGTTTLWDWIEQHPKIKRKTGPHGMAKEIHSLDNAGGTPRGEGQIDYDGCGFKPIESFEGMPGAFLRGRGPVWPGRGNTAALPPGPSSD